MGDTLQSWERQPDETDRSWAAFEYYRNLPIYGETPRSLENTRIALGYADKTTLAKWSTRYAWVARARAYDMNVSKDAMTIREVSLKEMQAAVREELALQLIAVNKIIYRALKDMQTSSIAPKPSEIAGMVSAIRRKDDLARRLTNMPVNFTSSEADELGDEEERNYLVGGN